MRTFSDPARDAAAMNSDLESISLGMFATEAAQHTVAGIAGESKLKLDDVLALVDMCSGIHQRYDKFRRMGSVGLVERADGNEEQRTKN